MAEVTHLSVYRLDRVAAELAPSTEMAAALLHIQECASCAAKLAAVRSERSDFLARHPPARQARALLAQRRPRRVRLLWFSPLLAAAAALGLFLLPPRAPRPPVLAKGGPAVTFLIHRPATGASWTEEQDALLSPGDQIQLQLQAAGMRHVAVYGMDHRGAMSHLFSTECVRQQALAHSLVLDAEPRPERLFVLFSQRPLSADEVARAARRAFAQAGQDVKQVDKLDLPATVRSLLVRKRKNLLNSAAPDVIPTE